MPRKRSANIPLLPISEVPIAGEHGLDHQYPVTPVDGVNAVSRLVFLTRDRGQLVRADTALTNQIKAIKQIAGQLVNVTRKGRAGDATAQRINLGTLVHQTLHVDPLFAAPHFIAARKVIRAPRRQIEREIIALTDTLPVAAWRREIRGFGPLGLGLLIGATGDLSRYANPAKVWKRMGLAVGDDGRAQRRIAATWKGRSRRANVDAAIKAGFSPSRRALMHVLGEALIKQNRDGAYRQLYLARKAYEAAKAPELPLIAHHKRALRYMEKRLLRDLWVAWRDAVGTVGEEAA